MATNTKYRAKKADINGFIHYSDRDNTTWKILIERQLTLIENRACNEYIIGLRDLDLPRLHIPQLADIDDKLGNATGWRTEAVSALISFERFFTLLANKKFPVATFIRNRDELDYLQEPDIFHEIFGHCPLLLDPDFASFTENYGKLAKRASKEDRRYLARLYWFTVEFGLLDTDSGLRIYGGGILSSKQETLYALTSEKPHRVNFNIMDVLRTPYRIDVLQEVYFKISSMQELSKISQLDLLKMVANAKELGLYSAS
jgi:phenylalanine-4-hydroxylase